LADERIPRIRIDIPSNHPSLEPKATDMGLATFRTFALALQRWWQAWFVRDAALSAAMARIGIFAAMWVIWLRYSDMITPEWLATKPPELYNPVGVLKLFGSTVPSPAFFEVWKWTAGIATICAILGLCTRLSMVLSTFGVLMLKSVSFAWAGKSFHGENVVFLAAIAFLCASAGQRISLDAVLRGLWSRKSVSDFAQQRPESSRWPVYLAMFAVAFVYLNAFYWKLVMSGPSWIFSDNLRNALVIGWYRYELDEPPGYVLWIASHAWAWKAAALGNVSCQLMPILGVIFVRRPWVRAMAGMAFATETLALGAVMGLWHFSWLFLGVLFVDWERLCGWCAVRCASIRTRWSALVVYGDLTTARARLLRVVHSLDWLGLVEFVPHQAASKQQMPALPAGYNWIVRVGAADWCTGYAGVSKLLCRLPLAAPVGYAMRLAGLAGVALPTTAKPASVYVQSYATSVPAPPTSAFSWRSAGGLAVTSYILLFAGYFAYVACAGVGDEHRNYPFAEFPMYSDNRALRPYDVHQPFVYREFNVRIDADCPVPEWVEWKCTKKILSALLDDSKWEGVLVMAKDELPSISGAPSAEKIRRVHLQKSYWRTPPYPGFPRPEKTIALELASIDDQGKFHRIDSRADRVQGSDEWVMRARRRGHEGDTLEVGYYTDRSGPIVPLEGRWEGDDFYFVPPLPHSFETAITVRNHLTGVATVYAGAPIDPVRFRDPPVRVARGNRKR
jgi:hypothetical protein